MQKVDNQIKTGKVYVGIGLSVRARARGRVKCHGRERKMDVIVRGFVDCQERKELGW